MTPKAGQSLDDLKTK
jgi:hypothetical protein